MIHLVRGFASPLLSPDYRILELIASYLQLKIYVYIILFSVD